jgi:hypothetical protein
MRRPPLRDALIALALVIVRDRVQAVVAAYEAGVVVPGER